MRGLNVLGAAAADTPCDGRLPADHSRPGLTSDTGPPPQASSAMRTGDRTGVESRSRHERYFAFDRSLRGQQPQAPPSADFFSGSSNLRLPCAWWLECRVTRRRPSETEHRTRGRAWDSSWRRFLRDLLAEELDRSDELADGQRLYRRCPRSRGPGTRANSRSPRGCGDRPGQAALDPGVPGTTATWPRASASTRRTTI